MQIEAETNNMEEMEVQGLDIRDSDLEVLRALRSNEGHMAFQGLRRQMNMHQEKLSRSLQRLEGDGLVARSPKGYSLTARGMFITQNLSLISPRIYTTILQSMLPGDRSPAELSGYIEGRWFGDLRWLGSKEKGDEHVLRWLLGDRGSEVVLRLRWGQLVVETDASKEEVDLAFIAAHRILYAVLQPFRDGFDQNVEIKMLGLSTGFSAG
jgi:hypothetical protein